MLKIVEVTADWNDPAGMEWVRATYAPIRLISELVEIERTLRLLNLPFLEAERAVEVRIELKWGGWQSFDGTWRSGEFQYAMLDRPSIMRVDWQREFTLGDVLY